MRDHSGWRARIGLIYMASSTVMEPEFYEMSPEGVATCTIRTHLPKMDVAGLEQMTGSDDLERCTAYLARADLGVIAYGGTSATFLHGLPWDQKMQARMRANSNGIPVTTTSSASIAALRAVGARRISFVSPYVPDIVERGRQFFSAAGFDVLSAHGMNIDDDHVIGRIAPEQVFEYVKAQRHPNTDALFISCTNLASVAVIDSLERDLGIPVVSAVQATFWQCLRVTGITDHLAGFGRLFAR
jgi:maleate isomerase